MKLMKTTLPLNRALLRVALSSTVALACVTAFAADPTLVFTELPGDVLHASVGSVTPVQAGPIQIWDWSPPANVTISGAGTLPASWIEPDGLPGQPTTYNTVSAMATSSGGLILEIKSDVLDAIGNHIVIDGTPISDLFELSTPNAPAPVEVGIQFNDKGDVRSTVPDASSTLTLLGGALTLVGAVGRKLGLRCPA